MSDICERLVRFAGKVCISTDTEVEAAAIIEALRAELDILKGDMPARAAILKLAEQNTEIEALRAENARLLVRLEKAHSFIPRADWMQFFEEEHAAERADLESNND